MKIIRECEVGLDPQTGQWLIGSDGGPQPRQGWRVMPDGCYRWDLDGCHEPAAYHVAWTLGTLESEDGEIRLTGTQYMAVCAAHNAEAQHHPNWVWSRPLDLYTGTWSD
ncbi:MAG: hypothetical protein IRZ28_20830 [Steroidobacteraceae bacterium]|nr:hypothetical protein [Steroidobacteraceae bacterium]